LKLKNIFSIVSLPLFIMKRIIFPLWLCHHTSINNICTDRHLFFTLYLRKYIKRAPKKEYVITSKVSSVLQTRMWKQLFYQPLLLPLFHTYCNKKRENDRWP